MKRRNRRNGSRMGLRHIGQLLPELMIDLKQNEESEADDSVDDPASTPIIAFPSTNAQSTFSFYSTVE